MKKQKGVTLLELVIVIILIGIFTAFIVPGISKMIGRWNARSVESALRTDLYVAKMNSALAGSYLSKNSYYRIRIVDSSDYVMESSSDSITWTQSGPTRTLPNGITLNPSSGWIQFSCGIMPVAGSQNLTATANVTIPVFVLFPNWEQIPIGQPNGQWQEETIQDTFYAVQVQGATATYTLAVQMLGGIKDLGQSQVQFQ